MTNPTPLEQIVAITDAIENGAYDKSTSRSILDLGRNFRKNPKIEKLISDSIYHLDEYAYDEGERHHYAALAALYTIRDAFAAGYPTVEGVAVVSSMTNTRRTPNQ